MSSSAWRGALCLPRAYLKRYFQGRLSEDSMAAAGPAAAFAPNKHLAGRPSSGLPSDTPMAGAQGPASAATCASAHLRQLPPNGSAPRPFIPRSLIVSAPTATAANESAADTTTASMGSWRLAYALKQQRDFGVKRVVQKRRHQMRIVHPKQEPFLPPPASASGDPPKPPQPLPLSLVNSGPFDRRNPQKNFFVRADLYFRVGLYGFSGAKHRAVRYRKRLEMEWEELQETWKALDEQHKLQEQQRMAKRKTQQHSQNDVHQQREAEGLML
ncbi:AP2 domain transcription factor ap2iv-1 [Cyclospora cayetanensis]|uniref:AP2 domain transcription factor ap2iv-1 n=1 Tax=Cyclospora cayetanensis TaxID=88456 RepID=A0A1D3D8W6_9EIME|nr:AP2 domain transcription factor ap2iv-1 [Cyclospora cayetanensis]